MLAGLELGMLLSFFSFLSNRGGMLSSSLFGNSVACSRTFALVALLEFVVPPVEVDVKHRDGSVGKSCQQKLLVVGKGKRPHSALAGRESIQQGQVEGAPHLHDAALRAGNHVLAIATQCQALQVVVMGLGA
uniref:Putative secreted protein n=1 Tax=Ixodes ricinus TaxID=34613 RepID=A0A147BTK6_IXORI